MAKFEPAQATNPEKAAEIDVFTRLRRRVLKQQGGVVNRRHVRHECSCIGRMSILNRSMSLEGIISEISKGGLKFRPAKVYLLERRDTPVLFEFAGFRISGKIVATRNDGYGIALYEEIEDDTLTAFLDRHGGAMPEVAKAG